MRPANFMHGNFEMGGQYFHFARMFRNPEHAWPWGTGAWESNLEFFIAKRR
jgi:hypothetical protein